MKEGSGMRGKWIQIILFFGMLLLLAATPNFWDLWQEGEVGVSVLPVVLLLVVGVGVLGFRLGRLQVFDDWVWKGWLLGVLLLPVLLTVFDTSLAYVVQFLAILFLVIVGLPFLVVTGGWRKMTAFQIILIFVIPFLVVFVFFDANSIFKRVGPCHLLSELRQHGCVRSVGLSRGGPVLLYSGEGTQLVRAHGLNIWIEPMNRWAAMVGARAIKLDYRVAYLDKNSAETLFRGIGRGFAGNRYFSAVQTLISMPSGEIVEEIRDSEEGVSSDGFSNEYEPDSSFFSDSNVGCLVTSGDGRLAAQYGQDELAVFDGESRERLFSLMIDDAECPVFSRDGRFLMAPKNLGENALFVVGVESGSMVAKLDFGNSDIRHLEFSADGETLLVTRAHPILSLWYQGLIFDVEKLVEG